MSNSWENAVAGVKIGLEPTPEQGLDALARLVEAVQQAPKGSKLQTLRTWTQDPEAVATAAAALRADDLQVQATLEPLLRDRTLKPHIQQLLKAWQAQALQADTPSEPKGEGQDLRELLDNPELPPGLRCPEGWGLDRDGIERLGGSKRRGSPVAAAPVLVTGRLRDLASGALSLRLEWCHGGVWAHATLPRREALDCAHIVALAGQDAPVSSGNARDLVAFIAAFEAENRPRIPQAATSAQMGWVGAGHTRAFLWGRTLLRGEDEEDCPDPAVSPPARWGSDRVYLHTPDTQTGALVGSLHTGGTWEGWLAALEPMRAYPVPWLAVYGALAAPLLEVLGVDNFILDFAGVTSKGKTTTLAAGASVWGQPGRQGRGLISSWDVTRVYVERSAALLNHLPTFLDDTKRARKAEEVGRFLYDYASGKGRGRGTVQGVQATVSFRGVLLSTGEAPATSFTQDGGTRARTLSLWGSPFGEEGAQAGQVVRSLGEAVEQHHGHAGPRMVRWLLADEDHQRRVKRLYQERLPVWLERCGSSGVADRVAAYITALDVAAWVLHSVLGAPAPASDPFDRAVQAARAADQGADRAETALADVLSWATSQQHRFYNTQGTPRERADAPSGGWLGQWNGGDSWSRLALLPSALDDFLKGRGYDAEAVQQTWLDRGWRETDGTHQRPKVVVGDRPVRCVVLRREACDKVTG